MATKNQWRFLSLRSKFRDFSLHTITGRSFKILNVYMVMKNHEPVHVKHRKCIFVPPGEFLCMCIKHYDLIMQKDSQIIIRHKSFQII